MGSEMCIRDRFIIAVVDVGAEPPHHFAVFVAREQISDVQELEDGILMAEELLAFRDQVRDVAGVMRVEPEGILDELCEFSAGRDFGDFDTH